MKKLLKILNLELRAASWMAEAFIAVAFYQTDLDNVHTPLFSVGYTGDDGMPAVLSGNTTSQGGKAELSGIELDGTILLNDLWSLDFTYAKNDSEIKSGFQKCRHL